MAAATHLIAARVSPETKALFRSLAERQQMTESALLKRMVGLAVRSLTRAMRRFFCGFSFAEIAELWAVSERIVKRDWDKARVLLHRLLGDQPVA